MGLDDLVAEHDRVPQGEQIGDNVDRQSPSNMSALVEYAVTTWSYSPSSANV